ncbi:MAG: HlyD family efflux transporter periplasmic adaptor subunit [Burkholderiales bacterium]|nr:HlyD family efflux transporter periplasmic adaptor subunit [Burkholderiales bacterium]MBK8664903.1 HlyD family efflux transporter periplasmic adaptor subunit [Burkholderiales bacterium]
MATQPKLTRKIVYWLLAAAALALLAWAAMREPVQLASTAPVTRGPLEVTFQEEGKTRLKDRYVVTAPVAGTLRRITLQPGDAVRAGQVLAQIDPATTTLLDARTRSQAQADVRGADAQLAAVRQRISAAQAAERLAQTELRRAQTLQAAGAVALEQLDQARARADSTRAELAAARADEQAATERANAARALLIDEGRAGSGKLLTVTAPVAGRVLKRPVESATPVPIGQVLMEIGDATALEIEAEVLSTDAVRLSPGMPARVLRWGGEGVLAARIARVEPGGYTKVSALGVEEQRTRVILDFTTPREQWSALGDAYRVEVEFIVQQASDVLQVPGSALFRAGDGWAVYRLEGGKARRTPVQIGLRSATAAQVLEGLEAGQTVIVQPDDRIVDGTRIQGSG